MIFLTITSIPLLIQICVSILIFNEYNILLESVIDCWRSATYSTCTTIARDRNICEQYFCELPIIFLVKTDVVYMIVSYQTKLSYYEEKQ